MNGSGRGQAGALGVHELVGDLEAGREAARVALLVLRRAQPEVDLRSRGERRVREQHDARAVSSKGGPPSP